MMELCLGTVQFGKNYGINNQDGQPPLAKSLDMLRYATEHGINLLDTAAAYDEAEMVVGCFLQQTQQDVHLISKLRPDCLEGNRCTIEDTIRNELKQTLEKLHVNSIYGYLLHNAEHLYMDEVIAALKQLKKEGLIRHYGVSIYQIADGLAGIEKGCTIIQVPFSVFDQRAKNQGLLEQAIKNGVEIHTRSAFLQGLLMMDTDRIPEYLKKIRPYVEKLNAICEKYGVEKKDLLIGFVKQTSGISRLVFGVDNLVQLKEFVDIFNRVSIREQIMQELNDSFEKIEENLILPNKWGK